MSVETREKAKISKAETEAKTKTRTELATTPKVDEKDEDSPQLQHLNEETEGILVPALDQDIKNIVEEKTTLGIEVVAEAINIKKDRNREKEEGAKTIFSKSYHFLVSAIFHQDHQDHVD